MADEMLAGPKALPSITVGTTAVRLSQDAALELRRWTVLADDANAAGSRVYFGTASVANDGSEGFPLAPGAAFNPSSNRPYLVWAKATVAGCVLHFEGA